MSSAVSIPGATVALSTASVYPETCAAAFATAARLGYDAVEVMVWTDPVSQEPGALAALAELHGIRIVSVHAPTLLLTQRIWGPDPWTKVDRSISLAHEVGADTVVLHPPFRWQKEYARDFVEGVALREHDSGIRLAVENMFPWRARQREYQAYLPHWDPVPQPYDHVTLDLSHTATAGSDAMEMARVLGPRLAHVHLADGLGSLKDEHLVPGRGAQPCAEFLEMLAAQGFSGSVVVEVGTRRLAEEQRDLDLAEALAFARLHLAAAASQPPGEQPMSPRGRRPGGADTRAAILDAARSEFADLGYDTTSLRGIARRAEVDPALVHHYFGGKAQLFAAVMDIPADPAVLIARIVEGPREQVGEALVRTFLAVWDSPEGRPRFQALMRAAVTHEDATRMLREFLTREIFGKVLRGLATDGEQVAGRDGEVPADTELRAGLAASQMVGLALMRYIVEFPAVVDAAPDDLARLVGPTIQRYLAP